MRFCTVFVDIFSILEILRIPHPSLSKTVIFEFIALIQAVFEYSF